MSSHDDQTDIAALAAGVVAVSVSMFVAPGPYDLNGAMVGVTLLLVLYGYVWNKARSPPQSMALGSVCGIIALPIVGFAAEWALSPGGVLEGVIAAPTATVVQEAPASNVSAWFLLAVWVITGASCAAFDSYRQLLKN